MLDMEWICIGWELDERDGDTREGEVVKDGRVGKGRARLRDTWEVGRQGEKAVETGETWPTPWLIKEKLG